MNLCYCKAMRGACEHFSGQAKCLKWMSGRFPEKLNLTLNRQVWKDILLGCCPNSLEKEHPRVHLRRNFNLALGPFRGAWLTCCKGSASLSNMPISPSHLCLISLYLSVYMNQKEMKRFKVGYKKKKKKKCKTHLKNVQRSIIGLKGILFSGGQ